MLKIAQIIDREGEYKDKYKALYEARIIEDIQKEIENSGVSKLKPLCIRIYESKRRSLWY